MAPRYHWISISIQGQLHNRDKHTFSDPQYDKARSEVEEKVNVVGINCLTNLLFSSILCARIGEKFKDVQNHVLPDP